MRLKQIKLTNFRAIDDAISVGTSQSWHCVRMA